MLTYLLPTLNRSQRLRQTLEEIGSLSIAAHGAIGGAEVIVIDNASDQLDSSLRQSRAGGNPEACGEALDSPLRSNGMPLRVIRLPHNIGAAARNIGAQHANGDWIIMLDDDSFPLNTNHIEVLLNADDDIAAIGADIVLPDGSRESGGLPEVFIGCGVAIRRQAFLDVGGYDRSFDYYAEEYDLCAKLILGGWQIAHDRRFRVRHEKTADGRNMDRILHRLVRNNGWVAQRYAPDNCRSEELAEIVSRYARIAMKENAACGFATGMEDLLQTLRGQPHRGMTTEQFDRFTGLTQVRNMVLDWSLGCDGSSAIALVDEGKNAWVIRQALRENDFQIVENESDADALMIGTLSPGPMLDAFERRSALGQPVLLPWQPGNTVQAISALGQ